MAQIDPAYLPGGANVHCHLTHNSAGHINLPAKQQHHICQVVPMFIAI